MIPIQYIVALVATTLLLLFTYMFSISNKIVNVLVNMFLCLFTSASWMYIAFSGYNIEFNILETIVFTVIVILVAILLMIMTYKEPEIKESEVKYKSYTAETLIGMTGRIHSEYGENTYLGKLNDEVNSDILVKINKKACAGDKFVITDISNGFINADLCQ